MDEPAIDSCATHSVLLVKDTPAYVYLIRQAREDCDSDIQLRVVPDGSAALRFLCKDSPLRLMPMPALMVVDHNLPKLFGTRLRRDIRQLSAYCMTPIVIPSSAP